MNAASSRIRFGRGISVAMPGLYRLSVQARLSVYGATTDKVTLLDVVAFGFVESVNLIVSE
jgi:hypothetical protein